MMTTLVLLTLLNALPAGSFEASDGTSVDLNTVVKAHRFTAVLFFSAECPVQRSHDARFLSLVERFGKDVHFVAVDAQVSATLEKAKAQVEKRKYPFVVVVDPKGAWADALGARYSTTVVVLDGEGKVHYRGGIDDQRVTVSPGETPFLANALERLLAGKEPESVEARSLGCVLKRP